MATPVLPHMISKCTLSLDCTICKQTGNVTVVMCVLQSFLDGMEHEVKTNPNFKGYLGNLKT